MEEKLDLILKEIATIKARLDVLDRICLAGKQYEDQRDSLIGELTKNQKIKKILNTNLPGVTEIPMKSFFSPYEKLELTELDGLFLIPNNGSSVIDTSKTIIVEAKLQLDLKRVHTKLVQLQQIYNILVKIDTLYADPSVNKQFKINVDAYNVKAFPKNVVLLFAPDHASHEVVSYLQHVQNGTLNETTYNSYLYKYLMDSKFVETFTANKSLDSAAREYVQYIFRSKATTPEEINRRLALLRADMLNWKSKPLLGIKKGLDRWLIPYDEFEPALEYAKGRIGLYMYDTLNYLADVYITQAGGKILETKKTRRRIRLTDADRYNFSQYFYK